MNVRRVIKPQSFLSMIRGRSLRVSPVSSNSWITESASILSVRSSATQAGFGHTLGPPDEAGAKTTSPHCHEMALQLIAFEPNRSTSTQTVTSNHTLTCSHTGTFNHTHTCKQTGTSTHNDRGPCEECVDLPLTKGRGCPSAYEE